MNHCFDDLTSIVKDKIDGSFYYECDPQLTYINAEDKNIENIERQLSCEEYYLWILNHFKKNGDFKFIKVDEDNTKSDTVLIYMI